MTNREKMQQGLWYDANFDPDLLRDRMAAEDLYYRYNQTTMQMEAERFALLTKLLGSIGQDVTILTPFYVDYGYNCFLGDNVFLNHNAYLMDAAPIHIGKFVFVGPNFGCYTSTHALCVEERNLGLEKALPITIEDNVWIGGDVTVLPGVTIGSGSVIGAGSVVTKDVPPNVIACGNPCRVMRPVTEADRIGPEVD